MFHVLSVAHVLVKSSGLFLPSTDGGDMTPIDEDHSEKNRAIRKHTVQALHVFRVKYHQHDHQVILIQFRRIIIIEVCDSLRKVALSVHYTL